MIALADIIAPSVVSEETARKVVSMTGDAINAYTDTPNPQLFIFPLMTSMFIL